ncbi:hypothetical protein TSAR_013359 [Trichomalopsis sarcophagae]|uniref:PX domain-containing protein n=1 Tax=Trichomalopsis sarcophagae TaxID=543379 RepID=A0A232FDG1_9HYME|nr:hypothetical protein TSAR_013359 [Trichomalopsis sarcophagae]
MHFSVPDTQELIDEAGNAYLGYNVHINGLFHCTVRYKQLHNLHEQLVKDLEVPLPSFPPKKFFPLTVNQQEDRRLSLDKYIQTIGQNTSINNSELLNGFLLSAQLESAVGLVEDENVDVFLMNGLKINLDVTVAENSGQILKKVCKQIKLDEKLCPYFSLFIVYQDEENFVVLRKLQDFESPIITQRNMHKMGTRIVIGKWYWDVAFDFEMLNDSVALNLLYIQANAEVERGWIPATEELKRRLNTLKERNAKEEYLEIVRSLKYYGYIQFSPCLCDYPQAGSKVLVSIGKNELNIRIASSEGDQEEVGFKVTRMRCWRITTLHEGNDKYEETPECGLELSFEYLMAKDHLQWITISSEQAILMSVCLQSMIDELLLKNVGGVKNQEVTGKTWTYITRDGYSRTVVGSPSPESFNKNTKENDINARTKTEPIIKKITERFSAVKVKKPNAAKSPIPNQERRCNSDGDLLENNAFCMIGDDDL